MQHQDISRWLRIPGFQAVHIGFTQWRGQKTWRITLKRERSWYRCGGCRRKTQARYDAKEVQVQDLDTFGRPLILVFERARVLCPRCGVRAEALSWVQSPFHRTVRFEFWVARLAKRMSLKDVSDLTGLHWATVKAIDKAAIEKALRKRGKPKKLQAIGIDEHSLRRRHHYATVVADVVKREAWWVGKDRQEATLDGFFRWLGRKRSKKLKMVVLDMWKPYLASVRKWAGQAKVVFDKFHLLRHLGKAVSRVRLDEASGARKKDRQVYRDARWLLLTRWGHLSRGDRGFLGYLFRLNRKVAKAYLLAESFRTLWKYRLVGWGRRFLNAWKKVVQRSRLKPLQKFADLVMEHQEGILNALNHPLALGYMEGLNTKVRVVLRRAYGYRDFDYYRLKVLQACSSACDY